MHDPSLNGHSAPEPEEIRGFGPVKENPGGPLIFIGSISLMTWASAIVAAGMGAGIGSGSGRAGSVLGLRAGFVAGAIFGMWLGALFATRTSGRRQSRSFAFVGALGGFAVVAAIAAIVIASLDTRAGSLLIAAAGFPLTGPLLAVVGILAPGAGAALLVKIATSRGLVPDPS